MASARCHEVLSSTVKGQTERLGARIGAMTGNRSARIDVPIDRLREELQEYQEPAAVGGSGRGVNG